MPQCSQGPHGSLTPTLSKGCAKTRLLRACSVKGGALPGSRPRGPDLGAAELPHSWKRTSVTTESAPGGQCGGWHGGCGVVTALPAPKRSAVIHHATASHVELWWPRGHLGLSRDVFLCRHWVGRHLACSGQRPGMPPARLQGSGRRPPQRRTWATGWRTRVLAEGTNTKPGPAARSAPHTCESGRCASRTRLWGKGGKDQAWESL